ncbi:hypothetical protein POM88_042139 [Heracleum sosnowskyi]|uniref:Endonuclease/exonuclease/phosphatase domain-containing protein n=1 Tax=Heracleum sosnowskyi TaxID=360622 RepID=A0AAD8HH85_9APIA|nr:hypothetical protein POM88_042139 [Heracleum sosnowskyi]
MLYRNQKNEEAPPYPNHLIEGFKDCLYEADLHDLEIIGHQFTWEKGQNIDHWTEIKLDRVLANPQWLSTFDMAKVYNVEGSPSDHSPLILCPEIQFRVWLENALSGQSSYTTAKIITLYWSIWRARNDVVWNQKSWSSLRIVAKAWEYLSQWTTAQGRC